MSKPSTNQELAIKVAISADFFKAFSVIPRSRQAKVIRFIDKFRANPTAVGTNYEKIRDGRDPGLHSVRIDEAYRGIVHKPKQGNVYLLLWVAHHDDAYDWARKRICRVHPETGSIQVFNVDDTGYAPPAAPKQPPPAGLFHAYHDRRLLKLGIPEEFLPRVRAVSSDAELEKLDGILPQEASEALYMLAAGYTEDEVYRELYLEEEPAPVDTADFHTALNNNDTLRRFYVVEDELELQAVLNAPMEQWRVFLHPSQRRLVERDWKGPVRVLGGAGTGKTVAAMHRARWLAEKCFREPGDRILFTTYTRNLAADIQQNLAKICPVKVLKRIEVVNLDQWATDYLRRRDYHYTIDYGDKSKELWQNALALAPSGTGLPMSFYREEWEKVIQVHAPATVQEYFRIPRTGRGTRIGRARKKEIWPVFEEYRRSLQDAKICEREDALCDAAKLLDDQKETLPYRAVVVDEAQDMGPQAFKLIRAIIPHHEDDPAKNANTLFIAGDPHQKIYKAQVTLSQCGINVRGRRSRKLRLNYRTTEETRKWALSVIENIHIDDLDGEQDNQKGYRSLMHGALPECRGFKSLDEEIIWLKKHLGPLSPQDLSATCLVVRTNKLRNQYQTELEHLGIQVYPLKKFNPEDPSRPGIRLATMHRVKGLEFNYVIIASVNKDIVPLQGKAFHSEDPVIRKENEQIERSLLYVSATRARKNVWITFCGEPSVFLKH